MARIHIFHTNDIHSHFEHWPRMTAYVNTQRQLFAQKDEASFLIDIGDFIDRSNLFAEATMGKGCIQLLNEANYDVVTIGNNEGITLAYEDLFHLYDEAAFDVVVGNLTSLHTPNPVWLKETTTLVTKDGVKIGVIAATAPYELFYEQLGWDVVEPRQQLIKQAGKLKEDGVDIVICLSHLGITEDELLAQETTDIDVIFGAHTHHYFANGQRVNETLLTGGGKFGQYIGQLVIDYDIEHRTVVKVTDTMHEINDFPPVQEEYEFTHDLYKKAEKILSEPLYQLHKTYTKEWFHYSPLANLFADKILAYTNADMAMFNAGIFMADLKKGYVTAKHLHEILPHPINLCVVTLKGSEIKEIYRQAQNDEWPNKQLKGLGFRGVVVGKMLTYGFSMNEQNELYIKGELADLTKTYRLVTLDMFTFGFFFPSFKYLNKQYYLPEFIRDLLK